MTLLLVGSHNFNLETHHNESQLWRARETGEAIVLVEPGLYCNLPGERLIDAEIEARGLGALDDAGLEAAGAFRTQGRETEAYVEANWMRASGFVSDETIRLDKAQWTPELVPGDVCLAFHIPRDDRYAAEAVKADWLSAIDQYGRWFPEIEIRAICCYSWLFSPLLGLLFDADESRIVAMQQQCYLLSDAATDGSWRTFVFEGSEGPLSEAPRDTRIRRRVLDWLDMGGRLYDGEMVVPVADIARDRPYAARYEIEAVRRRWRALGLDPASLQP